jgi:uncharacterized cofD-like protein
VSNPSGPSVVAIGGGRGLATALRALRRYAGHVTAVVSVADDGGSSGELSKAYGLVAPGDLRKCLVALAPEGRVAADMFEYRFDSGPLAGHSLGNVIITGLAALCGGITPAIEVCSGLLECSGTVLPVSADRLELEATIADGSTIRGQALITASARDIQSVRIVPDDAKATPGVVEAILAADQIVIGPGSLFTSVIPPMLIDEVRQAIASTSASRIYVCNLVGQQAESSGLSAAEHYLALARHGIDCDVMIYHPWGRDAPDSSVIPGDISEIRARAIPCFLADASDPSRHDAGALASALSGIG